MRMSVITKEAQMGVDPHEEVKKLQDLVKKLELQNQQLRCRQRTPPTRDRISPGKNEGRTNDSRTNKTQHSFNKNTEKADKPKRREGSFKEGDFIILDELDLSDEESWLYSSPKGLTPEDRVISPYKWMRKDLEDPENKELQLARRALANKLDELALLTPSQQNGPVNRSPSNSYSSGIKSPFGRRIVDSRTFTRNRRKREGEVNLPPGAIPVIEPLQYSYQGKSENSVAAEDDSLADVIDVHEIARLQEESLKQYSPASTPKRNSVSSLSGRRSGSPLSSTSDIDGQDNQAQHPISPCAAQSINHNNELHETHPNTTAVHSRISNHSSPTNSHYGSNNSLDNPTENVRRSLPNLTRGSSGIRLGRGKNISESELQRPNRVVLPYQRIESRLTPPSQVGQIRRQSSPGSRQSPDSSLHYRVLRIKNC
ncbi:SLAIN motif-containing protein 2-like isoform X2 [Tachypleus tridentatus]|uniref:SLAIN motif-containing protein 2-like isoform X2 n=1 Tax=Tachypleus tridentatus TaxID=6853 RepID=UPI003FD28F80